MAEKQTHINFINVFIKLMKIYLTTDRIII